MAERYQDHRHIPDDDEPVGPARDAAKADGDPLAELARLIGQSDPFANFGRSNPTHPLRHGSRQSGHTPPPDHAADEYFDREVFEQHPAERPAWVQRAEAIAAAEPEPEPVYNSRPHPLHRMRNQPHEEPEDFYPAPPPPSPSRPIAAEQPYDDTPYQPQEAAYDPHGLQPAYDDGYAYPDEYADQEEIAHEKPRRTGALVAAAVLALAVVGTGGAFAYKTYISSPRSGEPPVITADTSPIKVVPPTTDATNKLIQDRIGATSGENIVSREEKPVDVRDPTKAGARNPFPPPVLPPSAGASVTEPARSALPGGDEPRKIRTFVVKGDQADVAPTPTAKQAPKMTPPTTPPRTTSGTSISSGPMSLAPQASSTTAAGSGYVVQLSSQRSESDAQASYRALQGKFPAVLGSRSPLIKRADLGEKGIFYRAAVGPFPTPEEAAQICGSLKTAGGQCVVQRN